MWTSASTLSWRFLRNPSAILKTPALSSTWSALVSTHHASKSASSWCPACPHPVPSSFPSERSCSRKTACRSLSKSPKTCSSLSPFPWSWWPTLRWSTSKGRAASLNNGTFLQYSFPNAGPSLDLLVSTLLLLRASLAALSWPYPRRCLWSSSPVFRSPLRRIFGFPCWHHRQ